MFLLASSKVLAVAALVAGDPPLSDVRRLPSEETCLMFCQWNAIQQEKIRIFLFVAGHRDWRTEKLLQAHRHLRELKVFWEAALHAHFRTGFHDCWRREKLRLMRDMIGNEAYQLGAWPWPIFPELTEEP